MKTRTRGERNREPIWTNTSARPYSPVRASRAPDALGRGFFLYLSSIDGAGVLLAVVFLDCHRPGRRADFSYAASVGRADLFRRGDQDVQHVGGADAHDGSRQGLVECDWALHAE